MLPKKNRADRRAIERVFSAPRSVSSPHLTFKFKLQGNKTPTRVSFVVPKTVAKKATDRNLLRRRGYLALEKYFSKLPAGLEGIFIFNKKSMEIFGKMKSKTYDPIILLEKEIQGLVSKI